MFVRLNRAVRVPSWPKTARILWWSWTRSAAAWSTSFLQRRGALMRSVLLWRWVSSFRHVHSCGGVLHYSLLYRIADTDHCRVRYRFSYCFSSRTRAVHILSEEVWKLSSCLIRWRLMGRSLKEEALIRRKQRPSPPSLLWRSCFLMITESRTPTDLHRRRRSPTPIW